MGTLSIEGYNTEYRGFLPTDDTSKLELIFCCREDPNSTLSQTLPLTYPFILLKVPVIKKKSTKKQNKKQSKKKNTKTKQNHINGWNSKQKKSPKKYNHEHIKGNLKCYHGYKV